MTLPEPTADSKGTSRRGGLRNVSMASRLALAILAITVASLVVTLIVSLTYGEQLADDIIDSTLETQLTLKAEQIEKYVRSLETQTGALAGGRVVGDAASRFLQAYQELGEVVPASLDAASENVGIFYRDTFAPEVESTSGVQTAWPTLLPTTPAAIYLQDLYVATGDADPATKRLLNDAGDGSNWSSVHADVHSTLLDVTQRLGISDLFIIDPDSGAIVYSTAKAPNFATSLDTGPHSGSTLAQLTRNIRDNPERVGAVIADVAPDLASAGRPVVLVGSPILDGDDLVGILVLQVPTEQFDNIMTSEGQWTVQGLGSTGEAFLVGADGRMRSVARRFVEDPSGYFEAVEAAGSATTDELAAMEGTDTTIFYQKVADRQTIESATGVFERTLLASNYLGSEVFVAYRPVDVDGVEWLVGAQMERQEIEEPISEFQRSLLIAVALFVVVITFVIVSWAGGVFRPIRVVGNSLRRVRRDGQAPELDYPNRAPAEFIELTHSIDEMLSASHLRQEELAAATEQHLDVMRSFLPASVADRLEAGDRRVLDHIPQASIIVLVVDELPMADGAEDVHERRSLPDRLVDELDQAAHRHGVEPVKLVGDAYFAACGINQPFLDHAPRAVAFAVDALTLAAETLASDRLHLAAGVHSGPISVGLSGSALLVYDLWGPTVGVAHLLARSAQPGQILASPETRMMLPETIEARAWSDPSSQGEAWEILVEPHVAESPS